ncbi:MAG: cupin domain-containing protein [Panacagrimonas sp.]
MRAAADPATQSEVLIQTTRSWDGNTLAAYPKGQPEISVRRVRFEPGARIPLHQHPTISAAVLLSGELTVTSEDGKQVRLTAGQALVELVHTWHSGRNEGKEVAELIVFHAGAENTANTVMKPATAEPQERQP